MKLSAAFEHRGRGGRNLAITPETPTRSFPAIIARGPLIMASILLANLAASAQQAPNSAGSCPPNATSAACVRDVSLRTLPRRFLHDQKRIWTFPKSLAAGKHMLPVLAIAGITSTLIVADAPTMRYFQRTSPFGGFTNVFNGPTTAVMIALPPAALLLEGHLRKNSYDQETALLAGEAFFSSFVPHAAIKMVTRRLPPSAVSQYGQFTDTFFRGHISPFSRYTSFPSGHAAAAFSVGAVLAERYRRQHRWVPWVAYAMTGIISFSRVAEKAHFPSDVFLGSALGYTIARYSVLTNQ